MRTSRWKRTMRYYRTFWWPSWCIITPRLGCPGRAPNWGAGPPTSSCPASCPPSSSPPSASSTLSLRYRSCVVFSFLPVHYGNSYLCCTVPGRAVFDYLFYTFSGKYCYGSCSWSAVKSFLLEKQSHVLTDLQAAQEIFHLMVFTWQVVLHRYCLLLVWYLSYRLDSYVCIKSLCQTLLMMSAVKTVRFYLTHCSTQRLLYLL